jgi:hypothetical protein
VNDNTLDPDLGNLADPRIQALAKEAKARGWDYHFVSNNHRFELHVEPKINRECHLVLGFAVSVRLGGGDITCIAHADGIITDPWCDFKYENMPSIEDESSLTSVHSLEDCCVVFDRGTRRYMAEMRRYYLEHDEDGESLDALQVWGDIEPVYDHFKH